MSNVVEFPSGDGPHLSGEAKCLDCQTRWHAVAPVGTCWLECPQCGTKRGVLANPCGVAVGDAEWNCNCGCDLFKIVAKNGQFTAIMCLRCGSPQEF